MVQVVYRSGTVLFLMLIFINAIPVPAVFADAPGTRGEEAQPIGGTQPSEPETGGSGEEVPLSTAQGRAGADARIWQGVQILPPPGGAAEQARLAPAFPAVQQTGTSSLLPWLSRELNPGNWILDAGLGIFTAITASVGEMFQQSVMTLMGGRNSRTMVAQAGQWSIIPAGCGDGALYNMIFCTPPALTYAHAGIQNVWGVLRAIATGLVTLLFLIRIGRMLGDGSRALTVEARPLIVTFLVVILFVQSTEWICQFLVDFFNAISSSILANASLTFPAQGDTPFNIGASIMALFFWLLVLILALKSMFRVIGIAILIGIAPLAGAMLMDRATASRFRSWFEKLIELLLEQVSVVIVITVATAMLAPIQGAGGGDQFVQFLLGTLTMVSALFGPSALTGIASGASGGYLASMLQMRVIGAVQKAGVTGGVAAGAAAVAGGRAALSTLRGAGGDPALSAAARRKADSVALRAGKDDRGRRNHLAFRMPVSDTGKEAGSQALRQYDRMGQVGDDAAQRQRAAIRANAMTAQARGLERAGQPAAAREMRERARLQRAFAHGQMITRPPRWGTGIREHASGRMGLSARGQERRAVYAQALSETRARHDAERSQLKAAIAAGQQELIAHPGTEAARRQAHERLVRNEARLRSLSATQASDGTRYDLAPVTRQEAAALAQQRWSQAEAARKHARPPRPSVARHGNPQAVHTGRQSQVRRINRPATASGAAALHQKRPDRQQRVRRTNTVAPPARIIAPAQIRPSRPRLRDMTPEARQAHIRARAEQLAQVQHARVRAAVKPIPELRAQAATYPENDPRALELQRQVRERLDAYSRHKARAKRYEAAAQGLSSGTSYWTAEQRTARRAAFLGLREEVRSDARRTHTLPEDTTDPAEQVRRARQFGAEVRRLAQERLGELAAPNGRNQ